MKVRCRLPQSVCQEFVAEISVDFLLLDFFFHAGSQGDSELFPYCHSFSSRFVFCNYCIGKQKFIEIYTGLKILRKPKNVSVLLQESILTDQVKCLLS